MFTIGKMHELLPKVPHVPPLKNALFFTKTEISCHSFHGGQCSKKIMYLPKAPYIFIWSHYFWRMEKLSSLPENERKFYLERNHKDTHFTYKLGKTRVQIIFDKSVSLTKEKIEALDLLGKKREEIYLEQARLKSKVRDMEKELDLNSEQIKTTLDMDAMEKEFENVVTNYTIE